MAIPNRKAMTTLCPECDNTLRFTEKLELGQFVVCPECEETLEVVNLSPLQVTWAFEDFDEEYEDDDDFDDDDEDFDDEDED